MRYYLVVFGFIVSLGIQAQVDTTSSKGAITMGEVVIEKEKKIELPKGSKRYQKAKLKEFGMEPLNLTLEAAEPELIWPPYKSDVQFEQVAKSYPKSKYQNYLRLGYGNYGSPLAELGVFEDLGVFRTSSRLFFESFNTGPVNGKNSGNSLGSIDLAAAYKSENFQITPHVNFENRQYRFYGNTDRMNSGFVSEDIPRVNASIVDFQINTVGEVGDFSYYITPSVRFSNQNEKDGLDINNESVLGGIGGISFSIDKQISSGFDLEGYTSSYRSGITYDRSLFSLSPWVKYAIEDFSLKGGFSLATGKSGEIRQSGFYPTIKADWEFADKWSVYGQLSGNVEWNGLSELLNENEFLDDSLSIRNVENPLILEGGLIGSPIKNLTFETSLTLNNRNNLPFYVPSSTDSSRFTIAFDDQTVNQVTFKTSVSYAPTTISVYKASLALNSYSVNSLDRPWHLPSYIFKLSTSHNIKQKLLFSASLISMGGIRAPANVDFGIVNLKSFLDVGIDLKYLITERASVWVGVNNIGNTEYERYLGYPVRSINFKIGAQYRF